MDGVDPFTDALGYKDWLAILADEAFGEPVTLEHSTISVVNVHSEAKCLGPRCPIHRRSDHAMRNFPQHWRSDISLMERLCPHGIGHPDPDLPYPPDDGRWVHGCDGCCAPSSPCEHSWPTTPTDSRCTACGVLYGLHEDF